MKRPRSGFEHDLEEPRPEEHGRDRERAPAGIVEREWGQDDEQPEEHRRQHVQPEPADEALITEGTAEPGEGRRLAPRPRGPRRESREREREDADDGEGELDGNEVCEPAEDRAEDRAEDGSAERGSDDLAATLTRRRDGQPCERSGPGRGAGDALDEAGGAERQRGVREGEREAGHGEQHEPGDHGPLRAEPGRGQAAGDPAEERAGTVGAHEQSRSRLREVEPLCI